MQIKIQKCDEQSTIITSKASEFNQQTSKFRAKIESFLDQLRG